MKSFNSQSLRLKIIILLSFVTTLFLGAFQGYTFFTFDKKVNSELKELGNSKVARLARDLNTPLWEMDEVLIKNILLSEFENESVHSIYVIGKDNINVNVDKDGTELDEDSNDDRYIRMSQPIVHDGTKLGEITLFLTNEPLKIRVYKELIYTLVLTGFEIIIIISLLWIMIRRIILTPLESLMQYTTNIANGDYRHSDLNLNNDEFGEFGESIDNMRINIEAREKELRTSTEELKAIKEQLEYATNGTRDGLWDWKVGTDQIYFSPRFKNMLGYKDDEFPNSLKAWEKCIHPDDAIKIEQDIELSHSKPGIFYENIHRVKKKDGSYIWVLDRAQTIFNEEGKAIRMVGFYTDITKQKELEYELEKQNEVLKLSEEKYKEKQEQLHFQAHHDALTGLPNRLLFSDRLSQSIEKAKRNQSKFALLFIDLDHFKEINDSLGHDIGDEILKEVTYRLSETIRDADTVARLGGDEFTVILEEIIQGQDASSISTKILESLAKSMNINDNVLYVSGSIGISIYPDDGVSAKDLLKYADSAMYKAKDEGRNNFQYYNSTMTELAFERVVMETSLRAALKNEEFVVYYQPQVNGITNKIIGMEALVRWQHPIMGLISPDKFIPLAESTGLIVELDRYVMRTAMIQIVQWHKDGLNPGALAMNLAVKQLQQKDFIPMFKKLMQETDCKAQWIELEVTEGQVMTHPEEAIVRLKEISDLGIELAVDDFGTGYSSLAYLKRLPIDKLKIDQAFVRDLPDDEEDAGITKAVIALSKSLNLKVIAEGVETKEQRDFLVENGCKKIQGYFYSKPVPANEFENILRNGF